MTVSPLIGKPAPSITLLNYDGAEYTLTPGQDGIPIALFFYPKAGTYGCTKEACIFRDALAEKPAFSPEKVKVVGLSHDPVEKQKTFVEKNKLTYPVLSDAKGEAHKLYGVGESSERKSLMGFSESRVTFIIDGKGIVRDSLDATLNYSAHGPFVAKWLDKLEAEKPTAPGTKPAEAVKSDDEAVAPASSEAPAAST